MKKRRIIMSLCGVVICAIAVGIFKLAALGVDPFQSLMAGLDYMIPISFGTLYMIANAILLCFGLVTDRHYIGIATFINLFLLGYITEYTLAKLQLVFPDPSLVVRFIALIIGIVIICIGSAIYMTADLGLSTYDAVAMILANKFKLGQFKYLRIITDFICIIIGAGIYLLAGGSLKDIPTIVGIGTIITAFFMGPLIEFFNQKIARPMLYGKNKDEA